MFKLVGVQDSLFCIEDTDDGIMDILTKSQVCRCLNFGMEVGGITRVSDNSFDYTDTYFPEPESDSYDEDEEDPYVDYFDDEEDYESEEEYDDFDEEDYDPEYEDGEDDDYYIEDDDDDYYDLYPDDIEDEQEVSTVNKLYSYLNEEQIKILKRYYLWYSQRIFDEGRRNKRTLRVTNNPRKLQKQKELNAMRNQGGLWAYAGFIDMGYRGAEYCTLGHPLRYVHLAWDTTQSDIENSFFGENYNNDIEKVINSTSCIKFGIDCISDFFEIDKEYTAQLRKAQREALKDMDFMCEYYENGIESSVINSFGVLDNIMNRVKKVDAKGIMTKGDDYKPVVPKSLSAFYTQFRSANMVVPKSLIQEIRDNLIGWEEHKFIGWREPDLDILHRNLRLLVGKNVDRIFDMFNDRYKPHFTYNVYRYLVNFFQLKSCGYYEYNADTFKDEGGTSKPVRDKLRLVLSTYEKNFWSDAEFTLEFLEKLCDYADLVLSLDDIVDGFRVPKIKFDHKSKWHLDMSDLRIDRDSMMSFNSVHNTELNIMVSDIITASMCNSSVCRVDSGSNKSLTDYVSDIRYKVDKSLSYMDKYQGYALGKSQEFCDTKNRELEEHEVKDKEREEKNSKVDTDASTSQVTSIPDEDVLKYCIDNADKAKGNKKLKFALSVLDTVSKTGKYSDKQMHYIKQIYSVLTGVSVEDKYVSDKVSLDTRKDIEKAIDTIISNPSLISDIENSEKVLSILQSIKKYRRISEKQMKYAELALDVVK